MKRWCTNVIDEHGNRCGRPSTRIFVNIWNVKVLHRCDEESHSSYLRRNGFRELTPEEFLIHWVTET